MFAAITLKIPMMFFTEIENILKHKTSQIVIAIMNKTKNMVISRYLTINYTTEP
jgi:hypothetical protein